MAVEGEPKIGRRGTSSKAIRASAFALGLLLSSSNLTVLSHLFSQNGAQGSWIYSPRNGGNYIDP